MNKNIFWTIILSALPVTGLAAPVGELTTFQPNTPALAGEVNGNFSALKIAIDEKDATIAALDERIKVLEETVAVLETTLNDATDNLAQLQSRSDSTHTFITNLKTYTTVGTHNGNPIIKFSGVNVMVNDGSGNSVPPVVIESNPDGHFAAAASGPNGLGNLIIGYDEFAAGNTKTGSHNLVIGPHHRYENRLGIVNGTNNMVSGLAAAVIGGNNNVASGLRAVTVGGSSNQNLGNGSVMIGGSRNKVSVGGKGAIGGTDEILDQTGEWFIVDQVRSESP